MLIKKSSGAFTGGVIGGLMDSINIVLLGKLGITAWLGVSMRPEFTAPWLYPRLVWSGLWMLLLMVPLGEKRPALRGCLCSLPPSAMMLFVVLPEMGKGVMGLGFGTLTPLVVIGLNCLYGMVAAYWYRAAIR